MSGEDNVTVTSAVSDKGKATALPAVSGSAVVEAPSSTSGAACATSGVDKAKVKRTVSGKVKANMTSAV